MEYQIDKINTNLEIMTRILSHIGNELTRMREIAEDEVYSDEKKR